MGKKAMNSLFLDYLIESENKIDENIEKWTHDFLLKLDRNFDYLFRSS